MDDQKRDRLVSILEGMMEPLTEKMNSIENELKELREQQAKLIKLLEEK